LIAPLLQPLASAAPTLRRAITATMDARPTIRMLVLPVLMPTRTCADAGAFPLRSHPLLTELSADAALVRVWAVDDPSAGIPTLRPHLRTAEAASASAPFLQGRPGTVRTS